MCYNPNCPHCAYELEFDHHCDMYDDGANIIVKTIGHCSNCGKRFKWEEVYALFTFQDLEENE